MFPIKLSCFHEIFLVKGKLSYFHTVSVIFTDDRLLLITSKAKPKFSLVCLHRSITYNRKEIESNLIYDLEYIIYFTYFITCDKRKCYENHVHASAVQLTFHRLVMFNLCNGLLIRLVNKGLFFDFRVNGLLFTTNSNGRTEARRGFRNV